MLKALPLSDFIACLNPGVDVYLQASKRVPETKTLTSLRKYNKQIIVSFSGITSIETAEKYLNCFISLNPEMLPALEKDVFLYDQIIGLSVFTTGGDMIGKVTDILRTGSNDVYVVKDQDREYLVPAIKDVVKKIDLAKKSITIEVMQGLLD